MNCVYSSQDVRPVMPLPFIGDKVFRLHFTLFMASSQYTTSHQHHHRALNLITSKKSIVPPHGFKLRSMAIIFRSCCPLDINMLKSNGYLVGRLLSLQSSSLSSLKLLYFSSTGDNHRAGRVSLDKFNFSILVFGVVGLHENELVILLP